MSGPCLLRDTDGGIVAAGGVALDDRHQLMVISRSELGRFGTPCQPLDGWSARQVAEVACELGLVEKSWSGNRRIRGDGWGATAQDRNRSCTTAPDGYFR
jgi:hypothetical protein